MHRKYLLDNARHISEKAPEHLKKVIISRDLTTEQRTEWRNRRRKRAWQTHCAEEAEMQGRAFPSGIRFAKPDTVAMDIDHRPSSLIHGKYMRAHENGMENQQSEYDQSTSIVDDTIIGGLSQENEPSLTNAKITLRTTVLFLTV